MNRFFISFFGVLQLTLMEGAVYTLASLSHRDFLMQILPWAGWAAITAIVRIVVKVDEGRNPSLVWVGMVIGTSLIAGLVATSVMENWFPGNNNLKLATVLLGGYFAEPILGGFGRLAERWEVMPIDTVRKLRGK